MQNISVGFAVKYYDYLGDERFGTVVHMEPSNLGNDIAYCYIVDDDLQYNIHNDIIINGKAIEYAEIRPSTEVYIDE